MLCYKVDNFFLNNPGTTSIDFWRIKNPEINEDLFSQFILLMNQAAPILGIFSQIYQIIISDSISFTEKFPLPDILSIAFDMSTSDDDQLRIIAIRILIFVLCNSDHECFQKIGQFYHERNFHEILFQCLDFDNEDLLPDIIFKAILSYSSTCIEARDAILQKFPMNTYDTFIQGRNIANLKYQIEIFKEFMKYPLDKNFLKQLFSALPCFASIENDEIVYHTLTCISVSHQQENWPKFVIKNNLINFITAALNHSNEDIQNAAIDILFHLSEYANLDLNILRDITEHFLIPEFMPCEFFTFRAISIFDFYIHHLSNLDHIEHLLQMGLIHIFFKILDEGCFESKKVVISTLIQLMKNCHDNQIEIIIEYHLIGEIFDVIKDDGFENLREVLEMLFYAIQVAEKMGCFGNLMEDFYRNEDFHVFLHELLTCEQETIAFQAKALLEAIEK